MKKEPTIKNVLAELEHLESRVVKLREILAEDYGEWESVCNRLTSSKNEIHLARGRVKQKVTSNMLKKGINERTKSTDTYILRTKKS